MTQLLKHSNPALMLGAKILSSEVLGGEDDFVTIRYVDGDNGSDSSNGLLPDTAFATIQAAITASGARDIVKIRAIAPEADASEPGTYEEDLTIPYDKWGLQLIGVSGTGMLQPFMGPKIKNATAVALLTVNAPGVHLSGLQFNCTRNSGTYGIRFRGVSGYATLAGSVGALIDNCYIKNASSTYGGINIFGGYATTVNRCTTGLGDNCLGIKTDCTSLPSNGHTIEYCNFKNNNGTSVALHLNLAGNIKDFNVDHCNFDLATQFIVTADGATGLISNSNFNDGPNTVVAKSTGKIQIDAANDEIGVANCWSGNGVAVLSDGG